MKTQTVDLNCLAVFATGSTVYPVAPCLFRRPSGRLEVVQLIKMMDSMVLKAGLDQQSEELTELSQVRQTQTLTGSIAKSHT